jgi:rod shape-determining protein MreC
MKTSFSAKILILLAVIIAFFIFINRTGYYRNLKNYFFSLSSSWQASLWQAGKDNHSFWTGLIEGRALKEENGILKMENQELLGQLAALKELRKENALLKEALKIGSKDDFQLKLCDILSKDMSGGSLLVNKGAKEGIGKNMPVIIGQKILVGRIGEVYEDYSEVILITSSKSSFDAKISEKETYGLVKGGSHLSLDLVPKEKEVSAGEIVLTSALGGIFPKNLMVGEVSSAKKSDLEPFQDIELKPSFDVSGLESLFIITYF